MREDLVHKKYEKIIAARERFVAAFIAETGLKPSQCVMKSRYNGTIGGWEYTWIERRKAEVKKI